MIIQNFRRFCLFLLITWKKLNLLVNGITVVCPFSSGFLINPPHSLTYFDPISPFSLWISWCFHISSWLPCRRNQNLVITLVLIICCTHANLKFEPDINLFPDFNQGLLLSVVIIESSIYSGSCWTAVISGSLLREHSWGSIVWLRC